VALIAIDVDIANTIRAIDEILTRRESEQATGWDSLGDQLQALSLTVEDLDRMYYALLAEVENIFEQSPASSQRITNVIGQASTYCTDPTLLERLAQWRGAIQAAAFDSALKNRRFRDLASTLRSIDDPLRRYIDRLSQLQTENVSGARKRLQQIQAGNTLEGPTHDQWWDLRTVLELLKLIAEHLAEYSQIDKSLPNPREACEEAIRNFDRALSLALGQLIGHARQDLALDRL
jgi:hypothetical protein